ncbi:MAG TPA: ADOP family duplicated permease [Terriglobales bacterium]|nr:ADOP family duplicated permease [Terriglobales bacterium]
MLHVLIRRFRSLFHRTAQDAELRREIDLHVEQLLRENRAAGMTEAAARRAAQLQFGATEARLDQCRDERRVQWIEDIGRDAGYALRLMRKSPAFTLTALLSLALGLGANTVVFSVYNALLLKPLPIPAADRVVFVDNSGRTSNSYPNYREMRDRNAVFSSLFAYRMAPMALEGNGGGGAAADRVWGYLVSGNYFEGLGLKPVVGRFFTPAEDGQPSASPYAVITYESWRNRFGGDPDIAGRQVRINGMPYTVLGVSPRGFHGTELFYWPEVFVPMAMQPQIEGHSWLDNPNDFDAWIGGRLKPGITTAEANANLATVAAQLVHERPVNDGMRLTVAPIGLGGSTLHQPTAAFGGGVLLLAMLVLLAACANLAALLMARGVDRERDLAVRVSLGAGRGRLVRQLLTEAITLALLGAAAGGLLALLLLRLLNHWRAPVDFPIRFDVSPDLRVFAVSLASAVATGVLFGLGPALRARKAVPALRLKGERHRGPGRLAARDFLLPVQLALCSLLVTTSLVAGRGLAASMQSPLGMQPDGAAMVGYDFGLAGYTRERALQLQRRVVERVSQLPGIAAAAFGSSVPLSIDQSHTSVWRDGTTAFRNKTSLSANYYDVSPGYFAALGTRLLAGRDFDDRDSAQAPAVAVVNETLARRLAGTASAVGRRFMLGKGETVEIVGVVETGKYNAITEDPTGALFRPMAQQYNPTMVLLARGRRNETDMAIALRGAVNQLDPHLAIYGVGTLRDMLGFVYLPMRAAVITLGAFGILALMLSFTGIFGLSAYAVSQRAKEIGIRIALGAGRREVLQSVFARIGLLVAIGAAAGLALGAAGAGLLASVVYAAGNGQPVIIAGAVAAVGAVALAAAYGPARRVLRTDPLRSLRYDG